MCVKVKSVWDTVNKCSVCCRTKQKIHAKKKKKEEEEEKAEKNPFYLNGKGMTKGLCDSGKGIHRCSGDSEGFLKGIVLSRTLTRLEMTTSREGLRRTTQA